MNLSFGSQVFSQVQIPLLWGSRAVIGHKNYEFSIIDLSNDEVKIEIIKGEPGIGVEYTNREDGYVIFKEGIESYFYSQSRTLLRDISSKLPECQISRDFIRIGTNTISSSMVSGYDVGIGITETGFFIGGPLPPGLNRLRSL